MLKNTPTRYPLVLASTGFGYDPRWLRNRSFREPAEVISITEVLTQQPVVSVEQASNYGVIRLDGELLWFDLQSPLTPPPVGTKVHISTGLGFPGFFCETAEDVEAQQKEEDRWDNDMAATIRFNLDRLRNEAIEFNAKLKLPFSWQPGIKMVRSGLSANSSGNGRTKATVVHITLLEPFKAPRFVRFYGDFLCTPGKAAIGSHWDGTQDESAGFDGKRYPSKVTCATCLRNAASLMKRQG